MKKNKKRFMGLLLVSIMMVSLFAVPVMAMEVLPEITNQSTVLSDIPTFAGRVFRYNTPTINLGRFTLVGSSKLHIYLPTKNNKDLMQGTLMFSGGGKFVSKKITNVGSDYWTFDAGNVGDGIWNVSLVDASAIGTSQQSDVLYLYEY